MTSPFVTGSEDTGLDSMTGIFSKRAGLERIKENHFLSYIDVVRIQRFESKSGISLQSAFGGCSNRRSAITTSSSIIRKKAAPKLVCNQKAID